jgi:hypothetical protein
MLSVSSGIPGRLVATAGSSNRYDKRSPILIGDKGSVAMKKIASFVLLLPLLLVIALAAATAQATSQEPACNVTNVYLQPGNGGGYNGQEVLSVSCSDSTVYFLYVGTPGGCYGDIQGVKAMEAIALSARITGAPVSIWWSALNCPGASNIRVMNSIAM